MAWKSFCFSKRRAEKWIVHSTLDSYLRFGKQGWTWISDINLATQFDNKNYALTVGKNHMKWKAGIELLRIRSKIESVEVSRWQ